MFTGTIRNLKREDAEAVQEIYALYWPDREFREKLITRLNQFLDESPEILESKLHYFVAEDDSGVVGVAGFRKTPEHMMEFTRTPHPAELYILASRDKGKGIGKALVQKVINVSRSSGYTEIVLYSGESHKDSWGFYDHLGFEKVASATALNGEPGHIWRTVLI